MMPPSFLQQKVIFVDIVVCSVSFIIAASLHILCDSCSWAFLADTFFVRSSIWTPLGGRQVQARRLGT